MLPSEHKTCGFYAPLTAENFETGIAVDRFNGVSYDGFRDHSGLDNHLLLYQGAAAFETRAGTEGLVLDNTNILAMRHCLKMGAGTIAMAFEGCYLANNVRYLATFESYHQSTGRTGNPPNCISRFVGSGQNRLNAGVPGQQTPHLTLAGASTGDLSRQKIAFAVDKKSAREKIYTKLAGEARLEKAPASPHAQIIPIAKHVVLGRLRSDQADADRTAVTGNERLWLSHVAMFGSFAGGNLIEDDSDALDAIWESMA